MIDENSRLALLMHGHIRQREGKMGFGLLRYGPRVSGCEITCVVDSEDAGGDLGAITGIATDAPIVATASDARALGANTMVIGVATSGGVLPSNFRASIVEGLHAGMSLVNGLHGTYAQDPEFAAAVRPPATIWDVRVEPPGLGSGRGLARALPGPSRVLTVGTDMAVGKMTATLELDLEARRRGLRSKFLATGQIGICISGDGVALDAVRVDFASAAVEQLCLAHGADHDILWVEGQGSVLHPGSTAWVPLLRGAMPTDLILVHHAGQEALDSMEPDNQYPIPPLSDVIRTYETVAAASPGFPPAEVRAIALNCGAVASDADADAAVRRVEAETGLPCADVLRHGAGKLLNAILEAILDAPSEG